MIIMMYTLLYRAFVSFAVDEVTPFSADLICKYSPGLNDAQREICRQYPTVMTILSEIPPLFYTECKEQFQHNRWNCSTTTPPIYGQTSTDLRRCKYINVCTCVSDSESILKIADHLVVWVNYYYILSIYSI